MITQVQLNKINSLKSKGWGNAKKIPTASGKTQILVSKGTNVMVINSHGHVAHAR